ncbi:tetratricopeptide repeat protein [Thermodesulfobacteriota bacterium]
MNYLVFIRIVLILSAVLFFFNTDAIGQGEGKEELVFKANQAVKEGRYREAIDGYNQLILSGHNNGHLYYNLGNAYFRENELGKAILNYEKARSIIPRDADLEFNLRYALDQTQDAIPEDRSMIDQAFFWLNDLTLGEIWWSFLVLNILFWAIIIVRLFIKPEWTYYFMIIFLIFWFFGGLSIGLKYYQVITDDRAVILKEEVEILAGPDPRDIVHFKLHEGAIVHHEREEDGWSLIWLPDKKRGWLKTEAMERIMKK